MGTFAVGCRIENVVDRSKGVSVRRVLVDTGSEYTWVSGAMLEKIGIAREKKDIEFVMANGQRITRSVGFAIVRVEGKVIRENQGDLRERLEGLLAQGTKGVALDLEKVDYMDSAGLGCCASVQKLIRDKAGGSLVVFGASSNIEKMWKLIRLDLVIPLFAAEKEALGWLASGASPSRS